MRIGQTGSNCFAAKVNRAGRMKSFRFSVGADEHDLVLFDGIASACGCFSLTV